jgi:hypothetical protein
VRDRCSVHGAHRARGQARPFGAVLGRRNATAATPGGERSYSRRRGGSAAPGADIAEFDRAANLAHLLCYSFGHRMGRYIEVDHSTPFISQHQKRTTPGTRIVWSVWQSTSDRSSSRGLSSNNPKTSTIHSPHVHPIDTGVCLIYVLRQDFQLAKDGEQ